MPRPTKRQMASKTRSRDSEGKLQANEVQLEDWQAWSEDTINLLNRVQSGELVLNMNEVLFDSFDKDTKKRLLIMALQNQQ